MIRSDTRLIAAPAAITALKLIHFAGMARSKIAAYGIQLRFKVMILDEYHKMLKPITP